jgi:hypothetical protein
MLLAWWAVLPVLVTVLVATAIQVPVLVVPALGLLVFAWTRRKSWDLPRSHQYTTFAMVAVVLAAFLMQKFVG